MNDQFFNLFAGLIWVNNFAGTTLLSQNHGTAVNLRGPAIAILSTTVSVTDNHIITDREHAFAIDASKGLFTDNLSNQTNDISVAIEQPHNIRI